MNRRHLHMVGITALMLLLVGGRCAAEVLRLDMDDAIARALKANINLQAERKDVDVAAAGLKRSDAWLPGNPYLSFGASAYSPQGNAGAPGNSGSTYLFGYLSQEFEVAGQRGLRQDAARFGAEREDANIKQAQTSMVANVKSAFVRTLINRERTRLAAQTADLNQELLKHTEADKPSSPSERIELNSARIQALRAQRDLAAAEQARDDGLDALRRLLDLPFDTDVEPVGTALTTPLPLPPLLELLDRANRQRGDLRAFEHAAKGSDAQLQVARRERIPNVTLSGSYSHFDGGNFAGGDIGVPLPVFQTKEADVIEAAAERERADLQLQDMRREVEREVRETRRAYDVAAKDLEAYRSTILPLSEESVRLQRRLLDKDEANEADLITQQIEALSTQRDYLEVLERFNIALIDLERSIGGPLASGDAGPAAR